MIENFQKCGSEIALVEYTALPHRFSLRKR